MKKNFDKSLTMLLAHEGGYNNNPHDPGGMTNLGVTRKTWEAYTDHDVTEADMRALTPAKVAPLYRDRYWNAVRADELPSGVDHAVFDFSVHSGPIRAIRTLQIVLDIPADGRIGPRTLKAVAMTPAQVIIADLTDARIAFLKGLAAYDKFGRGWIRRVNEVAVEANELARA